MLEILPHEIDLAHYIGTIIDKLRSIASTQFRQSDIEMLFGRQEEPAKIHQEISFEEVLMLRLVFEIAEAMRQARSIEFIDYLESIVPDFEDYRRIILAAI